MKHSYKIALLFLALIAILALVSLPTLSASQQNTTFPLIYPARVINTSQQACPPGEMQETVRSQITQDVRNLLRNFQQISCQAFQAQTSPANSCIDIPTSCSSGYYWIRSSNSTAVQVFCEMDRLCGCNSTGGWTRVASLNMTDRSQQCPGEWILRSNYSSEQMRLCGSSTSRISGCLSATFSTHGISYSHVCGRITGYQYATTDAFYSSSPQQNPSILIDSYYVDGVSLTHGPPGARQHIWTFAAGLSEPQLNNNPWVCPCADRDSQMYVPSYVGNDYFCESGNPGTCVSGNPGAWEIKLYSYTQSHPVLNFVILGWESLRLRMQAWVANNYCLLELQYGCPSITKM